MKIPYTTALAEKKTTEAVIVAVETDEGLRGLGQAAASAPRYAPEPATSTYKFGTSRA